MSRLPSLRAVPWLAAGGLLLGHAVATAFTASHGATSDLHAYLAWAGRAGTVAATLGLAALLTARLAGAGRPSASFAQLGGRLTAIQGAGFLVMEITERVANHAPLGDLITVLPVGLAVQAAIALAIAAVLRRLLRTADLVHAVLGRAVSPPEPAASVLVAHVHPTPSSHARTSRRDRAPPAWAPPLPA
jgi:hypothetical protein